MRLHFGLRRRMGAFKTLQQKTGDLATGRARGKLSTHHPANALGLLSLFDDRQCWWPAKGGVMNWRHPNDLSRM
jgi:hypothetical protein